MRRVDLQEGRMYFHDTGGRYRGPGNVVVVLSTKPVKEGKRYNTEGPLTGYSGYGRRAETPDNISFDHRAGEFGGPSVFTDKGNGVLVAFTSIPYGAGGAAGFDPLAPDVPWKVTMVQLSGIREAWDTYKPKAVEWAKQEAENKAKRDNLAKRRTETFFRAVNAAGGLKTKDYGSAFNGTVVHENGQVKLTLTDFAKLCGVETLGDVN